MIKKNWRTILVAFFTVILGGIAVFTALRLYTSRNEPVAPTAPAPGQAAEITSCILSFSVSAATPPTATPTSSFTVPTPEPTPTTGYDYSTPTPTRTLTPTRAPTITTEATQAPTLPEAGFTLPTLAIVGGGILLAIFGLIFVL